MTGRTGQSCDYLDVKDGDTDETEFLRSTPWIIDAHTQDPDGLITSLRQQAGRFLELPYQPKFTLLVDLRDTLAQHLKELILSVRCQTYANWELVLLDNGSTPNESREIVLSWVDRDKRIQFRNSKMASGSIGAANLAVEESTGDYLVITDGDGVMHPMALGVFARSIIDDPKVNFVFTNEAEIDTLSTCLTNFFVKPPLDIFTLLRVPYIGRLAAMSRELLESAAQGSQVFREEYDGIEEHDLWLRLALTEGFQARHVSLFTYYRRAGSNGLERLTDQELVERRRRLAEEFVSRVYPGSTWSLKVNKDRDRLASTSVWLTDVPGWKCPSLLIVVPFKDQVETTIQCLESIERQEHRLDVVVALVNNRSLEQETLLRIREWIGSPRTAHYQVFDHEGRFQLCQA